MLELPRWLLQIKPHDVQLIQITPNCGEKSSALFLSGMDL